MIHYNSYYTFTTNYYEIYPYQIVNDVDRGTHARFESEQNETGNTNTNCSMSRSYRNDRARPRRVSRDARSMQVSPGQKNTLPRTPFT